MNICMFTNTYLPMVGGVPRSIERFAGILRERGHRVLVVAPEYPGRPSRERDVVRIPAIQNFNGGDFSVVLPVGARLNEALDDFQPQILHAHHPFLLGDTALRAAAERNLPLVFTHHTMYEHYTHYTPLDSSGMARFVQELSTGFANLCNRVIAPSESVKKILERRGVQTSIQVIPTGVELPRYAKGNGIPFRQRLGIPEDAFVVGHVGRLAFEKNLSFLARSVSRFVGSHPRAYFLVVGKGGAQARIRRTFKRKQLGSRLCFAGVRKGQELTDAYHAMDVFAFASTTETQGMVLVEALASGCPCVALDAPGAREVVRDGENGRLVQEERRSAFAEALHWMAERSSRERQRIWDQCIASAKPFALETCVESLLLVYQELLEAGHEQVELADSGWEGLLRSLEREWELWRNRASALAEAMGS